MGEVAEFGSFLPAILLFVLWWALLAVFHVVSPPTDAGKPAPAARDAGALEAVPVKTVSPGRLGSDPAFDEKEFLQGASKAYEIILQAYAEGDTQTLLPLLGKDVMVAFGKAIAARRQRKETMRLAFICLKEARLTDRTFDGGVAEVTVRFTAEIMTSTVPQGDAPAGPGELFETNDLWTFARHPATDGRGWRLVATEEG